MFKLTSEHRFWATVTVHEPGSTAPTTFEMCFEALSSDDAAALVRAANEAAQTSLEAANAEELRQIRHIARDWRDVVDADGAAVPFSDQALEDACRWAWVRTGIIRSYGAAVVGARLGN